MSFFSSVVSLPPAKIVTSKNNRIMFMFVIFSWLYGHFKSLAFSKIEGTNFSRKQSNGML